MKLKTWITVFFLSLAAGPGFARESGPSPEEAGAKLMVNRQAQSSIYELIYLTNTSSELGISVQDCQGNTLVRKRIKVDNGVRIPFNLKFLPFGRYTFIVNNNGSVTKKVINHTEKREVNRDREIKVSLLNEKGAKKYKMVALRAYETPVDVLIFDLDNNLIHKDKIRVSAHNFIRVYDLSKVPTDHFTFEVYNNGRLIAHNTF